MKKAVFIFALSLVLSALLYAGDLASFINLGFSKDSRYFMFGQYGIKGDSSLPYAELYTVDVHRNAFTPQGVLRKTYTTPVQPGQDGYGALLSLFWDVKDSAQAEQISPLLQGRLVYFLVNGAEPQSQITFRDFQGGNRYEVNLNQNQFASGDRVSAAFHIKLKVFNASGAIKAYLPIGLPNYRRNGVKSYKIRQIFFSPDEASLVFVVEREEEGPAETVNIRFMVETVKLN